MSPLHPMFTSKKILSFEDYFRFNHSLSYIKQKSDQLVDKGYKILKSDLENPILQLMHTCGIKNLGKFRELRTKWDNLVGRVPLKYFIAIGVDFENLKLAQKTDMQEFLATKEVPLYPKYAGLKHMALPLPQGTTEKEALEILKERNTRCSLIYPGFKIVHLDPTGKVSTQYCPPIFKMDQDSLNAREDFFEIGDCYTI